tara:strand:- start:347 stop:778 length:432 start_codon:yes stop_codon:yes gene_type:complete
MTVKNGDTISIHYRGTFDDGTEFDNSFERGEPITCQVGAGMLISGFDNALPGMEVGETKNIQLAPDQAYGEHRSEGIQQVTRDCFPEDFELVKEATVYGKNGAGEEMIATIVDFNDETATLDFNHPMAGKSLNFEINVVDILE